VPCGTYVERAYFQDRREVGSFLVSEQTRETADDIKNYIKQHGIEYRSLFDLLDVAKVAFEKENDTIWALKVTSYIKDSCRWAIQNSIEILQMDELYWRTLKVEALYHFESFLFYMEKNRRPEKKFYEPRMRTLKIVVDDLQDLEDRKLDFYGLSLPPRVGKSTLCIFFLTWVIGRHPESHNAMSGHSGILADRFYRDVLKLTENEEYTFKEIFPEIELANKSSEKNELFYSPTEAFATLTCRGIDGTWTGAVDISSDGYLYVDDMVRDRTESLSPIRLENRYQDYLNVLVDRKNDGSKELMVGTRWNVLDPLGRVEAENKNNPKYRFRKIPALNEKDESNFQYDYGVGFSTEYYRNMRDRLDRNEWMAKYQQMPFVREGLLFPLDELNYYNGVLPDGECITAAACDVAWGGNDSLSMPFGKLFGSTDDGPIYIPDWIFNKGDKYTTKPIVVAKTLQHQPNMERFEANNGGDEYAEDIDRQLKDKGFKTNISWAKASNQISKMAKIIQYAPDIKRRFYFLKPELQSEEYRAAMEELGMFTQLGKNEHDDSPDGLVQLFQLFDGGMTKIEIMSRAELGI
jgi:predicted phage terminase large subunit-like protein